MLRDVRDFTARTGVQYILTVIDSDLPRDEADGKVIFDDREVIRSLHDQGDDGRLFRMPAF